MGLFQGCSNVRASKASCCGRQMKLSCGIGGKVLAWLKPGDVEEEEAASSHGGG